MDDENKEPSKDEEMIGLLNNIVKKWQDILHDENIDGIWYGIEITIHDMRHGDDGKMVSCSKVKYDDLNK